MIKDELWSFKYEPTTLENYIVSPEWKERLQKIINECPNFILSGPPGIGKSTFMNIFINETQYDCLKINASIENGADIIRSKIWSFATTLGMTRFKIVYLNEAERLTQASQEMLRQLMEDVQEHTRFAFVCNSHSDIHEALISRCTLEELSFPPAPLIFEKCLSILDAEKISYDQNIKSGIINMIKKVYPDVRRIINSLQSSVINGKILSVKVNDRQQVNSLIIKAFFEKDINEVRKILRNNAILYSELYSGLFENMDQFKSPGDAIILLGEYLYRDKFVSIQEINFIAMMVKMMKDGLI